MRKFLTRSWGDLTREREKNGVNRTVRRTSD